MLIYIYIKTLYSGYKVCLGGSGGSVRAMGEWLMGQWIVDVIKLSEKIWFVWSKTS